MKSLLVSVETGREIPDAPNAQVLSSVQAPWQGVFVEQVNPISLDQVNVVAVRHVIVFQLEGSVTYEWESEGRSEMVRQPPGHFSLFPAFIPFTVKTKNTGGFLSIMLEPSWFRCATEALIKPGRFNLKPCHGVHDPLVSSLAQALKTEIETGYQGGSWYGESLAGMLAIQLVRRFSDAESGTASKAGGLSRPQLRRAIEFINDHLAEDFSVEDLAAIVGLSHFHFARLFKSSTGIPPHQYVVRRRVEQAKELLLASGKNIAQIALEVGFCEQSHLASQFKRAYGIAPKAFRRKFLDINNIQVPG